MFPKIQLRSRSVYIFTFSLLHNHYPIILLNDAKIAIEQVKSKVLLALFMKYEILVKFLCCLSLHQKVLAAHGATKVSAYVTHAVFPNRSWGRFIHKSCGNHLADVFKYSHLIYLYMSRYDFPSTANVT